jgi:hypothetical protein
MLPSRRRWAIAGFIVALFILFVAIAVSFVDEPLRQYFEQEANEQLQGYELRIGKLNAHPFSGAFEFRDVSLRQSDHPDPPLAWMESWTASILWRDLLFGRVVSDHRIVHPTLTLTRPQAQEEAAKVADAKEALQERGWQEAVLALFPITINEFAIENAEVTYRDHPNKDPMHLSAVNLTISNIQNVRTENHTYPSKVYMQGRIFERGRFEINGHADFLAQPYLGLECDMKVEEVPAEKLGPVAGRYNIQIRKGVVTAQGHVEYAPWVKEVRLQELLMDKLHADYVHSAATAKKEKVVAKRVAQKAKEIHQDPELKVKIEHGKILNSEIGFVNTAASRDYRVFMSDMNVEMDNFSNRLEEGTGLVKMTGKFMGSGPTTVSASFRPEKPRPDFDLEVRIVKTKVKTLNNLFRAYGDVDTAAGTFAFFSELSVKDNRINGYVKPFLKDVEVYDPQQDQNKAASQKIYEAVVGSVLDLLKNIPHDEVATKTDLSGAVENPQANTWEIVEKLVQNAFFKAILPGFERKVGKA